MKQPGSFQYYNSFENNQLDSGVEQNMLDLSEPSSGGGRGLQWLVPVAMIAVYGTYLGSLVLSDAEKGGSAFEETADPDTFEVAGIRAALALGKDDLDIIVEAPEPAAVAPPPVKPVPAPVKPVPPRVTVPAPVATPPPVAALPAESEPEAEEIVKVDAVTVQSAEAPEEQAEIAAPEAVAETAPSKSAQTQDVTERDFAIPAWPRNTKVAPAAYALLARIHNASEAIEKGAAPSSVKGEPKAEAIALNAPLPERRPYVTEDIAGHEPSSQSGTRIARLQPTKTRPPAAVRSYRARVRSHLSAHKPSGGYGPGMVRVRFMLSSAGEVVSARIVGGRRASELKAYALKAIYHASPFPSAPESANTSFRKFTVSFVFE